MTSVPRKLSSLAKRTRRAEGADLSVSSESTESTVYLCRREGWEGSSLTWTPLRRLHEAAFCVQETLARAAEDKGVTELLWDQLAAEDGFLQHLLKDVANRPDAMEGALAEEGG